MAVCKSVQCSEKTGASVLKYSTAEVTPGEGAAEVMSREERRISPGINRVVNVSRNMTGLMGRKVTHFLFSG